ncbi:MAG: hypothetical protein AB7O26_17000 [Planctomycetaceae bacterium]
MERRNFLKTGLAVGAIQQVMSVASGSQVQTADALSTPSGAWKPILATDAYKDVRKFAIRLLTQSHLKYLGLSDELGDEDLPTKQQGLKKRLDAKFKDTAVNKLEMFGFFLGGADSDKKNLIILLAIRWMKYDGSKKDPRLKMIALNPKYFPHTPGALLKWAAGEIDNKLKDAASGKVVKLVIPPDVHSKQLRQLIQRAREVFNNGDDEDRLTEIQRPDGSTLWKIKP